MKDREKKPSKKGKGEFRSMAEFKERFYPKPVKEDVNEGEAPDATQVAHELAEKSLSKFEAALAGSA